MGSARYRGRKAGKKAFELVYQVAGHRHFDKVYCDTKTEAERELKIREAKALQGHVPSNPDLTFDDMKDDFINRYINNQRRSLPSLRSHLVHLTAYFGGRRARSITPADVRAYTTKR